jgi:molecular chaperone GrpE
MAEFDNYKKRSAKERENIYTDVRVDTVTRFLPVYDNLVRALNAETADAAYKRGVEMTFQQLEDVFHKLGVEEIESVGKPFDPQVHNAVMHVEDETKGENEIVEEFQKGFRIGDKVIRFSMVKVAN